MSNGNSTELPGKTLPDFTQELSTKLLQLDDNLHQVLSRYHFYTSTVQTTIMNGWPASDKMNFGLTLNGSGLEECGSELQARLTEIRAWVTAVNNPL